MVSTDLSSALFAAVGSTLSLVSLQAGLSATNGLTIGTAGQATAIAAVGSTLEVINNQMNQQCATLTTPIQASVNPGDFGQAYVTKVSTAASLAATVNVRSYVGRIGTNIARNGA